MKMQFARLDDHEPPCLVLVQPSRPSKRAQRLLGAAGFAYLHDCSEWWAPLAILGRRNISDRRLVAVLSEAGIDAAIERRTFDEQYGVEPQVQWLPDHVEPGRRYVRGGTPHFMDPTRKVLVPATPEEHVRQRLVNFLTGPLGFPLTSLATEVPLARLAKRVGGRADLVIWNPVEDRQVPWAVIECKKEGWDLNDVVWAQVEQYGRKLGAEIIGVTNGERLDCRWRSLEQPSFSEEFGPLPTYRDALDGVEPPSWTADETFRRPTFKQLRGSTAAKAYTDALSVLHPNGPADLAPQIINLGSLFFDPAESPGERLGRYRVAQDLGIRRVHFGNAGYSSQAYSGAYRAFILEVDGEHQVVSFRIWAVDYGGNTSILAVGTDKGDQPHHALQLNLRRSMRLDDGLARLSHDGRLALGEGGSIGSGEVLEFVREHAPDLVDGDRVDLGTFPAVELVNWANSAEMFDRLVRYVFLRDKLRQLRRSGLR